VAIRASQLLAPATSATSPRQALIDACASIVLRQKRRARDTIPHPYSERDGPAASLSQGMRGAVYSVSRYKRIIERNPQQTMPSMADLSADAAWWAFRSREIHPRSATMDRWK